MQRGERLPRARNDSQSYTVRSLYTPQHEVVLVKNIYGLVNSLYICAKLPLSGELLCDFFFFKHFPINLYWFIRSNGVCLPYPLSFILELE